MCKLFKAFLSLFKKSTPVQPAEKPQPAPAPVVPDPEVKEKVATPAKKKPTKSANKKRTYSQPGTQR